MLTDIFDTVVADPWPYIQGLATFIGFVWLIAKAWLWLVRPALRAPAALYGLMKQFRLSLTSRLIHAFGGRYGFLAAKGFFWTMSAIGFTAAAYVALDWHLAVYTDATAVVLSVTLLPWFAVVGVPSARRAVAAILAAARFARACHDRIDALSISVEAGLRQAERDILAFAASSRTAQAEEDRQKPIRLVYEARVPRNTLPTGEPELEAEFTVVTGPRHWWGARKRA